MVVVSVEMVRKSRRKQQRNSQPEKVPKDNVVVEGEGSVTELPSTVNSATNNVENTTLENRNTVSSDEETDTKQNSVQVTGEQNPQEDSRVEEKQQVQPSTSLPFQNALQKKLFDIRLRMNEGRKLNSQAVEEELKTNYFRGKGQQVRRKPRQHNSGGTEGAAVVGLKDKFWRETAEQAEQQLAKELTKLRRSGQKLIGETIYGEDNLYRAYEKRLTRIPANEIDEQRAKEEMDQLEYGQTVPVNPDRVERLVQELEETEERRRKFSKWHKFDEETADISFINERNRRFNDKIARSFDEYTQEIRQNLERGTALP